MITRDCIRMNSSSHSSSRPSSKDIYLGKDLNKVAKTSDKTTRDQLEQYRWFLRFSGTIPKEVIDIADSDAPVEESTPLKKDSDSESRPLK